MTNQEFKYWLNGYMALSSEELLNAKQIKIIQNHANLVKTVEENLDQDIVDFLKALETESSVNGTISFMRLKEIATLIC